MSMKIFYLLLILLAGSFHTTLLAQQTLSQLNKQIAAFQKCFNEMSRPALHDEVIRLSNGKIIRTRGQSDFSRSQFTSVDALLENVKLWKDSPYLWQARQKLGRKTLMDVNDLTDWEVKSLPSISSEYFEEGQSAFHIAAHGLVEPDGAPANAIQMGGETLNAQETAELILQSMCKEYHSLIEVKNEPFVVVLHCCHSAKGSNNFAQQLSKELSKYIKQVAVIGAPGIVYCEQTADGKYTESVTPQVGSQQQLPWKVYQNGTESMTGASDYKQTIRSYVRQFAEKN